MWYWVLLWVFSLISIAGLIFFTVYLLVSLADLETTDMNPIDMCRQLNILIMPEMLLHWVLNVIYLVTGHFFEFILLAPISAYHAFNVVKKKHTFDATQIFRVKDTLRKIGFVRLGFYFLFFFWLLYRLITSIIAALSPDDMDDYSGRNQMWNS